jgi:hypothetical protein
MTLQQTQAQANGAQMQAAQAAQMQAQIQAAQARLAQLQAQAAQMLGTQPQSPVQHTPQTAAGLQPSGVGQAGAQQPKPAGFSIKNLRDQIQQATGLDVGTLLQNAQQTHSKGENQPATSQVMAGTVLPPAATSPLLAPAANGSPVAPNGPARSQEGMGAGSQQTIPMTLDQIKALMASPCTAGIPNQ